MSKLTEALASVLAAYPNEQYKLKGTSEELTVNFYESVVTINAEGEVTEVDRDAVPSGRTFATPAPVPAPEVDFEVVSSGSNVLTNVEDYTDEYLEALFAEAEK